MNVFKRFADIVSSNINSALDKMEDPGKMINLMTSQMEETAIGIRASVAEKTATLTTIQREADELDKSAKRWEERAKLAVGKGKDDLAREAITEKRKAERQAEQLKGNIRTMESIIAGLREQLAQVEDKLSEMKAKRTELAERAKAAKEKIENNKTMKEAESSDFARRFEELQARIERWEAEAKVFGEANSRKSTRETFEDMEAEKEVEDELARLKAEAADKAE